MNIYIDESGIFRNPANKSNIASCIAALIVPSSKRADIVKGFTQLKMQFGKLKKEEIKGSQLNENQISGVVSLLRRYDVVLELIIMDLGLCSEQDITDFKVRQANNITANITPQHSPNIIKETEELKKVFLTMSNPLFVQAFMLTYLIPKLIQKITIYYSHRIPKELNNFHWVIDAKDKQVTEFEKAWSTIIYPIMYTQSLTEPFLW